MDQNQRAPEPESSGPLTSTASATSTACTTATRSSVKTPPASASPSTRPLTPKSPDFKWVDQGLVLESTAADRFNAIDPNFVRGCRKATAGSPSAASGMASRCAVSMTPPACSARADTRLYSLARRSHSLRDPQPHKIRIRRPVRPSTVPDRVHRRPQRDHHRPPARLRGHRGPLPRPPRTASSISSPRGISAAAAPAAPITPSLAAPEIHHRPLPRSESGKSLLDGGGTPSARPPTPDGSDPAAKVRPHGPSRQHRTSASQRSTPPDAIHRAKDLDAALPP